MHKILEDIFNITNTLQGELVFYCEKNRCRVLSFIPSVAAEIADCVGFEAMFVFVSKYGGRKIYLPATNEIFYENFSLMIDSLNYGKIKRLARANNQLDIPSSWGVFLSIRRCAIYSALNNGWSPTDVVRVFGITERQLSNISKSIKG